MNDDEETAGSPADADEPVASADAQITPQLDPHPPEPGNGAIPLASEGEQPGDLPLVAMPALAAAAVEEETDSEPQEEMYQGHPQRGFVAEWVVTIILLLFGTTNLVQAFVIPTGSMEDTLLIGDHLLVDKLAYSPANGIEKVLLPYLDVKRGDIIVFRYPMQISQTFVKRCIGVPGDRIHLVNKQLWLNGKPIVEPYAYHKSELIESYRDNFPAGEPYFHIESGAREMLKYHLANGDVVVPEGQYFAMGDNRDESSDSRFWGFVPRGNIIGKPLVIYWSYDAPTDALAGPFAIDHLLDMVLHFPTKTRWSRTFQFIHGYPLK